MSRAVTSKYETDSSPKPRKVIFRGFAVVYHHFYGMTTIQKFIIKIPGTYYSNLQAAYDIAPDNTVIRMLDGVDAGPLTANSSVTITISGGYNAAYTAQTGSTDLLGKVTIQKGTVNFDRVIVR